MFWKKKPKEDKNAAPPKSPEPPPARAQSPAAARAPEPPRAPPAQPAPSSARPQPSGPAGDLRGQLVAALARSAGPQSAPMTTEAFDAQKRALDMLIGDASLQGVVRDLAGGQTDAAFAALERFASGARSADAWRNTGALIYGVDGVRARKAYEQAFALEPRHFWGAVFLARLRALTQDLNGANDAAAAAIMAGQTPDERGIGFFEAAMIAMGRGDVQSALTHGAQAVQASRESIRAGAREALAVRDFVARLTLLADANVMRKDFAAAQPLYAEALSGARQLAAAAGPGAGVERGIAELLEKSASVAASAPDYEYAIRYAEEAVAVRREILRSDREAGAQSGLASALNSLGEVRRQAGLNDAAKVALKEALDNARAAFSRNKADTGAQRDVWLSQWRLASIDGSGVSWREVAETMERVVALGGLNPNHQHFLEEARRRAAA